MFIEMLGVLHRNVKKFRRHSIFITCLILHLLMPNWNRSTPKLSKKVIKLWLFSINLPFCRILFQKKVKAQEQSTSNKFFRPFLIAPKLNAYFHVLTFVWHNERGWKSTTVNYFMRILTTIRDTTNAPTWLHFDCGNARKTRWRFPSF